MTRCGTHGVHFKRLNRGQRMFRQCPTGRGLCNIHHLLKGAMAIGKFFKGITRL